MKRTRAKGYIHAEHGDARKRSRTRGPAAKKGDFFVDDEVITSDEEDEGAQEKVSNGREASSGGADDEVSADRETADEVRLKTAKNYLESLQKAMAAEGDETEENRDELVTGRVAEKLRVDILKEKRHFKWEVADLMVGFTSSEDIKVCRGHKKTCTSVCISEEGKKVFSAGKDGNLTSGARELTFGEEHCGYVLDIDISSDGLFLVAGGQHGGLRVYDARDGNFLKSLTGHRQDVTGVAFQRGTHQFFSCSIDRIVRVWNVDEMMLVDTLFGHQDSCQGIDCLSKERALSCGSDRSIRLWKLETETQLLFTMNSAFSVDTVCFVTNDSFVAGSADGSLSLWHTSRKKPVAVVRNAHRVSGSVTANGVSAVAALPHSDLVASGSCDGIVRLWKVKDHALEQEGIINDITFGSFGSSICVAVGQEPRLGRWVRDASARNGIRILRIPVEIDISKRDIEAISIRST